MSRRRSTIPEAPPPRPPATRTARSPAGRRPSGDRSGPGIARRSLVPDVLRGPNGPGRSPGSSAAEAARAARGAGRSPGVLLVAEAGLAPPPLAELGRDQADDHGLLLSQLGEAGTCPRPARIAFLQAELQLGVDQLNQRRLPRAARRGGACSMAGRSPRRHAPLEVRDQALQPNRLITRATPGRRTRSRASQAYAVSRGSRDSDRIWIRIGPGPASASISRRSRSRTPSRFRQTLRSDRPRASRIPRGPCNPRGSAP